LLGTEHEVTLSVEQDADDPAPLPEQVQPQEEVPLLATDEAVPALHRLLAGALVTNVELAEPHWPFTPKGALQDAVVPPLVPAHVHGHGPLPETAEAVPPLLQSWEDGALDVACPFAEPHLPFVTVPPPLPPPLQADRLPHAFRAFTKVELRNEDHSFRLPVGTMTSAEQLLLEIDRHEGVPLGTVKAVGET
jgi:hypothetical protein